MSRKPPSPPGAQPRQPPGRGDRCPAGIVVVLVVWSNLWLSGALTCRAQEAPAPPAGTPVWEATPDPVPRAAASRKVAGTAGVVLPAGSGIPLAGQGGAGEAAGAAVPGETPGGAGGAASGPPAAVPECVVSRHGVRRFADPVIVRGEALRELLGSPLDSLRLLAWREGEPGPIPFQVDEYTEDERKVLPLGAENNRQEGNRLLDPQDELVFMAHDLGDRLLDSCRPRGALKGLEIEVQDPVDGGLGWCTLLLFGPEAPPLSPVRYVDYDWDANRIRTAYYDNLDQVERKGDRVYRKIFYVSMDTTPLGGGEGVDYIDTMKFVGEANLLYSLITFRANHGDVAADTIAYLLGPVRGIRRCYGVIKLPLNLDGPKIVTDVCFYETLFSCPLVTHVPFNPRVVFTNLKVRFGTDLNREAAGMLYYNSRNPLGYLVDGVPAPAERAMDTGRDEWRLYTGAQGTMMMRSVWDESYVKQAKINVLFRDDPGERDPPENVPGEYGSSYSLSTLENIRAGDYCAWLDWYFPPGFHDPGHPARLNLEKVQAYLDLHDRPLRIRVAGREWVNQIKLPQVKER